MEITHQHKHTHTIPCFTIYCTVILCKWYLHHGVVCFLMVLASPISSSSGSKPFPHSLLELEIKQAGTINLSTSCARSVTVGNKSVWIVQELNIQLPPTYMNNKDSIWHNSTVRKLVQIHLVSRNVLDWKNENTMVVCPSRSGLWQQPIKLVSADAPAILTNYWPKSNSCLLMAKQYWPTTVPSQIRVCRWLNNIDQLLSQVKFVAADSSAMMTHIGVRRQWWPQVPIHPSDTMQ